MVESQMRARPSIFAVGVVLLASAGSASGADRPAFGVEELLAGAPLEVGEPTPPVVDGSEVLAVSPAMAAFVAERVDRRASDSIRFQQLAFAIINEASFGLEHDEATRTAAETFRLRRGNCLSFSSLFVALAREAGLKAGFQEVDIPPNWTMQNDAYILNRHVNVWIDLGPFGLHSVDFNVYDFRTGYERRPISDTRAVAHYFNNKGVAAMQAGDVAAALAYYRRAILDNDGDFAPAWTNLGILYMRGGHADHAEAAFLQALAADRDHEVAMSNLVSLYDHQGDAERAEMYRREVARHRNQNPYYRFHLAREAFYARDFEGAISHLKFAVRRRRNEDQFCFLLGLSYLQLGDEKAARRWLERAERLAATESLKRSYSDKIDLLMAESSR
jgi:Flp pilus assembly protein TadD